MTQQPPDGTTSDDAGAGPPHRRRPRRATGSAPPPPPYGSAPPPAPYGRAPRRRRTAVRRPRRPTGPCRPATASRCTTRAPPWRVVGRTCAAGARCSGPWTADRPRPRRRGHIPLGLAGDSSRYGGSGLSLLVWAVYEIGLVGSRGQTLGMMAPGSGWWTPRPAPGRPRAGPRALAHPRPRRAFCLLPFLLVCLSPLFDGSGRQQGWHDKASRTLVAPA